MWWSSTKGKKVGLIVRVGSLMTWIPYITGNLVVWLFDIERAKGAAGYIAYCILGWFSMFVVFIIVWILRALWIWLSDSTGKKDPWKWGFWMN